jgi:hypothetical protein
MRTELRCSLHVVFRKRSIAPQSDAGQSLRLTVMGPPIRNVTAHERRIVLHAGQEANPNRTIERDAQTPKDGATGGTRKSSHRVVR